MPSRSKSSASRKGASPKIAEKHRAKKLPATARPTGWQAIFAGTKGADVDLGALHEALFWKSWAVLTKDAEEVLHLSLNTLCSLEMGRYEEAIARKLFGTWPEPTEDVLLRYREIFRNCFKLVDAAHAGRAKALKKVRKRDKAAGGSAKLAA
jgi:hypothetical protein